MKRPLLLDLFCGAGGCSVGYHRAGFDVIGVDIKAQPRYPFPMVVADALRPPFDLAMFDAIHASPPCQRYSALSKGAGICGRFPDLVEPCRTMLKSAGRPFVIENVPGAPLRRPTLICGSYFGLRVRRHRLFETNFKINPAPWCKHVSQGQPLCVVGTGGRRVNRQPNDRGGACNFPRSVAEAQAAMGIDWMTRKELSQAIPPAYTEFIGKQLLAAIQTAVR